MILFQFDLQRFSEGGTAASSSATASGGASRLSQNVTENNGAGGQGTGNNEQKDEKSQYEELKKRYKKYYDADVSNHVKNRHRDYKVLSEQKAEQDEFLGILHEKYGTKDIKGLKDAIEADDAFWVDRADEENMTVEQYKNNLKLKRERDSAMRELDKIRIAEQAREQYGEWLEQSKAVKEQYPEFELNEELKNPQFRSLLSAHYQGAYAPSMSQIYELIHRDEIMEKQKAGVQKSTIDNIKARGMRPDEAGAYSGGAVDYSLDASKMSRKERADIARRVKSGGNYTFGR